MVVKECLSENSKGDVSHLSNVNVNAPTKTIETTKSSQGSPFVPTLHSNYQHAFISELFVHCSENVGTIDFNPLLIVDYVIMVLLTLHICPIQHPTSN